jgi:hypothetical protein
MTDHSRYEELTALAAGGHLSADEFEELRAHMGGCAECQRDAQELRDLVHSGLPLTTEFAASLKKTNARPDEGARERFLARARSEGLRFSPNVEKTESASWLHFGPRLALVSAFACVVLLAVLYGPRISGRLNTRSQAEQQVARLTRENADLTARLAGRDQELAAQQKQIRDLGAQLGTALKTAESYRREGQEKGVRLERSTSESAQLLNELENRDKQLAASTEEIARINQLRATDKISLDAQRIRIKEISNQLRIADATLDMERQLSSAGQDIRQLLVSRQLHVVDVRDTDENGKPSASFARVFLTEGKSLTFFAFDLNDAKVINAKGRFQVWGEELGQKGSARSLGVLTVDDRTQNRWALKVKDPSLLNQVNAIFVTVSPSANSSSGPRQLYAYLGQPNHS